MNIAQIEQKLITYLKESYVRYVQKEEDVLFPVREYWANELANIFREEYIIACKREITDSPLIEVEGVYGNCAVDICVMKKCGTPILCLGLNFIASNDENDSIFDFSVMLGRTISFQNKQIPYAHFLVLKGEHHDIRQKHLKDTDILYKERLSKYIKLHNDNKAFQPFAMCVLMINIYDKEGEVITHNFKAKPVKTTNINISICETNEKFANFSLKKFWAILSELQNHK